MKVVCINENWVHPCIKNPVGPLKGDRDEVTGEEENFGALFYSLERFGAQWFRASHFVPISDITIEQLIGERELQEA